MSGPRIALTLAFCLAVPAVARAADETVAPSTSTAEGVPNFREVSPGVYRGGHPTAAGWAFLRGKGVRTVVKLHLASEGSDDEAAALGMTVIDASGPPATIKDVFGAPEPERLMLAVESLRDESLRPVYVHCLHGEDRTGLVVGLYRVLHDGKTKAAAYREMRLHGFHRSLRGLRAVWKRFNGRSIPGVR
ncbi:MAG: tyrosine-protein phosphatase [Elusimicrobia bacterium]|nr:tyrosine-protein phosphatase [Elusimicrobiota bacterium]